MTLCQDRTVYIGIDPGSNHIGLGWISVNNKTQEIHDGQMRGFRFSMNKANEVISEIHNLIEKLSSHCSTVISCEKPPPTARKDTNHGFQAPIGWSLGFVTGLIISPFLSSDHITINMVQVSDWRKKMLEYAHKFGPNDISKPNYRGNNIDILPGEKASLLPRIVPAKPKGWVAKYTCGHETSLPTYSHVANVPALCPSCSSVKTQPEKTRARETRNHWKSVACRFVEWHFSENYKELVEKAKKRARKPQEDHQLSGVSDACEALCISFSALICAHE